MSFSNFLFSGSGLLGADLGLGLACPLALALGSGASSATEVSKASPKAFLDAPAATWPTAEVRVPARVVSAP